MPHVGCDRRTGEVKTETFPGPRKMPHEDCSIVVTYSVAIPFSFAVPDHGAGGYCSNGQSLRSAPGLTGAITRKPHSVVV